VKFSATNYQEVATPQIAHLANFTGGINIDSKCAELAELAERRALYPIEGTDRTIRIRNPVEQYIMILHHKKSLTSSVDDDAIFYFLAVELLGVGPWLWSSPYVKTYIENNQ
jgi:hypothetical protein